jgi:hypothetical protein
MKKVKKEHKRGVNSLIILGAWMIWKHRNACVFEGVAPSVNSIMRDLKDEHNLWCLAGAKKLQGLDRPGPTGLCASHRLFRIEDGAWPTLYTSCNYSCLSRTSRNRRKLPETYSGSTPKLVSG